MLNSTEKYHFESITSGTITFADYLKMWIRKINELQVPRYIQSIMQAKDDNCDYLSEFN